MTMVYVQHLKIAPGLNAVYFDGSIPTDHLAEAEEQTLTARAIRTLLENGYELVGCPNEFQRVVADYEAGRDFQELGDPWEESPSFE